MDFESMSDEELGRIVASGSDARAEQNAQNDAQSNDVTRDASRQVDLPQVQPMVQQAKPEKPAQPAQNARLDFSQMSDEELGRIVNGNGVAGNPVAQAANNATANVPRTVSNEKALARAQSQAEADDTPFVAGLKGAAEGAIKGGAKAVKALARPFVGLATGAVRLAGTAQRALGLGDDLHRAANAADNAFANWGRDVLDLGYEDALTKTGEAGEKIAGIAGSVGSLAVGGVAGKAIGALGKAGSAASKLAGAVGSNLVPAIFANDAAVGTYDTAKENGQSTARALAEAGANATIHFIGFKLFENHSLNKMLGIPKEAANLIMPKSVMATAKDVAPQTFAQLVGAVRKGALREIVAERAKGALKAGGIMGVQNFLSSIPTQLSEGDKIDFARALGEGFEGVKEGALMEGLMGGAAALLTAKGARNAVKDAYLGANVMRTDANGEKFVAHKPGLVDSATGRAFICSQRTEKVQEIFDAVANGKRVTAKMLNDAALPNDMKPSQVSDFAEKCNYDAESSKVAMGIPNKKAGLFYEPSAAEVARADWEREDRADEAKRRYAAKTADERAYEAQHKAREGEILNAEDAEVEADRKLNRDLDRIGGPDEVAKYDYENAEDARMANIVADQFQSEFGQFCYRNRMNMEDDLAKLQFFRAVQKGEVDLRNAPIEPEVVNDGENAVSTEVNRATKSAQKRIGPSSEPTKRLAYDEAQTPYGPIVTPQTEANKWKASTNPGLEWGDIVREGARVKAEAEKARTEGRAKEAERMAGNFNRLLENKIGPDREAYEKWVEENGLQGVDLREAQRRYAEEMAAREARDRDVQRQLPPPPPQNRQPRGNPITGILGRMFGATNGGRRITREEATALDNEMNEAIRRAVAEGRPVTDAEIRSAVEDVLSTIPALRGDEARKARLVDFIKSKADFYAKSEATRNPAPAANPVLSADGRGKQPKPSDGTIYAGTEPGRASANPDEVKGKPLSVKQIAARERSAKMFKERANAKKREDNKLKQRFVEEEQMNPNSVFSFAMESGGSLLPMPPRKHIYDKRARKFKYVFEGEGPAIEALNRFFDGLKGKEYALWRDRIFGKGAKPTGTARYDAVLEELIAFQKGGAVSGENGITQDDVYGSRYFQDYDQLLADFRDEYEHFDKWKNDGAVSREERELAEQEAAEEADEREYYLDQLAAKDKADAEYANALGEIEKWDGSSATVQAFSPENLSKLKPIHPDEAWEPNDIVRFDHSDTAFGFVSFDKESGMLTLAPIGVQVKLVKYLVTQDGVKEIKEVPNGRENKNGTVENRNGDAEGERGEKGGKDGKGFSLESKTAEELKAEDKRIREQKEIEKRKNAPLKGGKGETGQTLMDLGGAEGEDLFNPVVRQNNAEPNRRTEAKAESGTAEGGASPVTGAEAVSAQRALGNDATKSTDALLRQIPLWRKLGERGAKKADAAETLIAYREQLKEFDAPTDSKGGESGGGKFHGSADDAYKRGAPVSGDGAKIENSKGYRDWLKANGKDDNTSMRRAYANEAVRKLTDLFGKAFRSMGFGEGDGARKGLKFSFVDKIGDAGKIPGIRNNRSSDQIPLRDSGNNIVGAFNRRTGEVKVLNGVDPNVAASALTHEIGHAARLHAERLAARGDRTLLDAMDKVVADAPESLKTQIAKEYGDLKYGAFADEVWAHFAEGKYSNAMLRAATEHKAWYAKAWDAVKRAVVSFCEKAGIAKPSAEKICDRLFDSIGRGEDVARGEDGVPEAGASPSADGEVRYRRRSPAPTAADIIDREEDWRERARHALQDNNIRIRNVQDEVGNVRDIVDRNGHTDWRRSTDVYEAINRSHGYVEKENRKLQSEANSVYADMARDGITANQLNTYLLAIHAKERNETIAQRNGVSYNADYAEGAGISENSANAFLARIPAAKRAELDAIERKVHKILVDDLDRRLASGRITQEYHDLLTNRWKHYIPLRTVDHATADAELGILPTSTAGFGVNEHRTARGIGAGNAFVATGGGGNRLNVNPLAFAIEQAEEGIRGSMKNEIRNVAANLVEHSIAEGKGIGDIVQGVQSSGERNWGFAFSDGERIVVGGDMRLASNRKDVILFKRDGELCAIKLLPGAHGRGLRLGEDLSGDNVARWHDSLQWIPRMTRWMSEWRTQNVPTFVWRNWIADHVEAYQAIVGRYGIANGSRIFSNVIRNEFRNARDLRTYLRDPNAASGRVREFAEGGGLTGGGTASEGYDERVSHIKDEYGRYVRNAKSFRSRVFGTWKPEQTMHVIDALRGAIGFANEFAENSTRVGIFSALRDAGVSVPDAIRFARDATVDFNRKGAFMPWINGMFMFANAAVQGATRSAQALTDSHGGQLVGLLVAAGVAKSLLDHYLGNDEDREKEGGANARNKSEYEKKHALGIPVGGGRQMNIIRTRGPYAAIPYMVQTLTDAMLGETDAKTALKRIAGEVGDQATDLIGGGLSFEPGEFKSTAMQTLAPSAVDPLVQFVTGRDYKGDLRVRRSINEDKPNAWNGKKSTAAPYKEVAKALNWLTGGGEFRKGGIDVAPEDVQLVVEFVWGGVGRDVSNAAGAAQMARRVAKGEKPQQIASEIPFVRDVVREYPNVERRYYEAADEVEADKYELRNLKGKARAEFVRSHRYAAGTLDAMEKEIKRLGHIEGGEAVAKNGKVIAANFSERQKEFARRSKLELMAKYLERLARMKAEAKK